MLILFYFYSSLINTSISIFKASNSTKGAAKKGEVLAFKEAFKEALKGALKGAFKRAFKEALIILTKGAFKEPLRL